MEKGEGAVTASSSAAAEVGADILRRGGNAVATALASCVAVIRCVSSGSVAVRGSHGIVVGDSVWVP